MRAMAMAGAVQSGDGMLWFDAVTAQLFDVILPRTMDSGDAAIIRAVLDGNTERYAELVDRYQQPSIRLAYSLLGSAEDARDASQEAFISAFRSLRRFRGDAKFSTWLYRIVVNKCNDIARGRMRQAGTISLFAGTAKDTDEPLFIDTPDDSISPQGSLANKELAIVLTHAIASLSVQQRTAFSLHHLNGLSLEEVASIMGCRIGTVKSHVYRATETLRVVLAPWRGEAL